MTLHRSLAFTLCLGCLASTVVQAEEANTFRQAFTESKVSFNFRYRYEFVDDDNIAEEANASTLRSRLTWQSAPIKQWSFLAEADHVAVVGDEQFNSTENGLTEFPVVADPEGFDVNQVLARYKSKDLTATFGRQRINHEAQRFIGGVAWRQNEQTYDAVRAQYRFNDRISVDYSYVWNVNRIFGPDDGVQPADWRSNSHFVYSKFKLADNHQLNAFVYLLDFENDNGLPNSNSTYGVSYQGKVGPVKIDASYATQSDFGDSPLDYDADYLAASVAIPLKPIGVNLGYELLGSDDGNFAFRTPLATLHKFQGFADRFLVTPAVGIEDVYAGITAKWGKLKLAATYHEFAADEGSTDFGDEINAVATYPIRDELTVQLKFADYRADEFSADKQLFWLSFIAKL